MISDANLVNLLKKLRYLLKNFLELTNDNLLMLREIMRLRDLLNHDHLDLRQFLRLEDKDRERIGVAQQYYSLDQLMQQTKKYLANHQHAVDLRLKTLNTYQEALTHGIEHLEAPEPQPEVELELMPARELLLSEEYDQTIHEAREMRRHLNYVHQQMMEVSLVPELEQSPEFVNLSEVTARLAAEFENVATELAHIAEHEDTMRAEYDKEHREMVEQRNIQKHLEEQKNQSYHFYPWPPVPTFRPTGAGKADEELE